MATPMHVHVMTAVLALLENLVDATHSMNLHVLEQAQIPICKLMFKIYIHLWLEWKWGLCKSTQFNNDCDL